MKYYEYQPSTLLLPYIETYWSTEGFSNQIKEEKILPDGCVDIIFSFGDSFTENSLTPFIPNVVGTMTTYSKVFFKNNISIFGIRFTPGGVKAFIKNPIYEFKNQLVDVSLTDSIFDSEFYLKLPELLSIEEKIKQIDSYLLRKIQYTNNIDTQISFAIDLIRKANGRESPKLIANTCCLSLRHFERKFKSIIGISPKTFSKIEKFKMTVSYLRINKNVDLFTTAIECGYYDESHLIKDFKKLSGDSPSQIKLK